MVTIEKKAVHIMNDMTKQLSIKMYKYKTIIRLEGSLIKLYQILKSALFPFQNQFDNETINYDIKKHVKLTYE